jgi:hypothetical protein
MSENDSSTEKCTVPCVGCHRGVSPVYSWAKASICPECIQQALISDRGLVTRV